jgi:hypothetical protein
MAARTRRRKFCCRCFTGKVAPSGKINNDFSSKMKIHAKTGLELAENLQMLHEECIFGYRYFNTFE